MVSADFATRVDVERAADQCDEIAAPHAAPPVHR